MIGTSLGLWQEGGPDEVREVSPRIPGDQHHERMDDNPPHAVPGPAPETRGQTGEANDPDRLPGGAGVCLDLFIQRSIEERSAPHASQKASHNVLPCTEETPVEVIA